MILGACTTAGTTGGLVLTLPLGIITLVLTGTGGTPEGMNGPPAFTGTAGGTA